MKVLENIWLVWLYEEKESGMKIIEKLRGNMVIYIYPGPTSFLSPSHTYPGAHKLYSLIITPTFHLTLSNSLFLLYST